MQTHVSHILAKLGARSRAEIIREVVRGILVGSPRRDDMELMASEFNQCHPPPPAGYDQGRFTVSVHTDSGWACIEVATPGDTRWTHEPAGRSDDEYGRGLAIVAAIADKFGHDVSGVVAKTAWAEITWKSVS